MGFLANHTLVFHFFFHPLADGKRHVWSKSEQILQHIFVMLAGSRKHTDESITSTKLVLLQVYFCLYYYANKTFRSKGAERPIKYPEIEEYLLKFWNSLHKDEYPLASILLQLEALDYDPLFLGGVRHPKFENRWACWCNHFMSRHNLVFRASSPAQNIPLDKDPIFVESSDFFTDTPLNG